MKDILSIRHANEHNLKDVSLDLPKNKLVVFTGVSGSGKSSLAMDTIYAEGQRRYVESLSSYARQFLGVLTKPDVESIEGLSPAIAIDQKTSSHNPRSTVGTITEIYDYFRLLFARLGHPHCPKCGREIAKQSLEQIADQVLTFSEERFKEEKILKKKGLRLLILAPMIKDRKGSFDQLFVNLKKQAFTRVRVDGQIKTLDEDFLLIKTNKHTIDVLVDRLVIDENTIKTISSRLNQSLEQALKLGEGMAVVAEVKDEEAEFPEKPKNLVEYLYSEKFACPICGISLLELEPRSFSFNSPHGACPTCTGLGTQLKVDPNLLYNPKLSISEGGIFPFSGIVEGDTWTKRILEKVAEVHTFSLNTPIYKLTPEDLKVILYGAGMEVFNITARNRFGKEQNYQTKYEGLIPNLERRYKETDSDYIREEISRYMIKEDCPACKGTRLKPEALSVTLDGKNIYQISLLPIGDLISWVKSFVEGASPKFSEKEIIVAGPIMREIISRLTFLLDVGLDYLTIGRSSASLAGGEAQRIRLASQIGSGLSGVLYVLDEPSIGLHARDQFRLINTLKKLRDLGNSVIVVEHDEQTIRSADYIVDFGPGAGANGGKVVAEGKLSDIIASPNSLTGKYLSGKLKVGESLKKLEKSYHDLNLSNFHLDGTNSYSEGKFLSILNCSHNNLKNLDTSFPLGKLICVTGVSGSGKSSLVNETLYRQLRFEFGLKLEEKPGENNGILGVENIDKVINIDQSPIGRTPRSNPATYTKVFDHIRELFAMTKEAKLRGYKVGRFSFNVKGGRCEACQGDGQIRIEMQFLPDVYVDCDLCKGKRYTQEVLDIDFKGKNIADVLDMSVDDALNFFDAIPQIRKKLQTLQDVGLGYIKLGQPAPQLSGGEAQRIKLASELSKKATGKTLYILDEPTTGLHFADLENLLYVLRRFVLSGNTVIVIEHNLDVIKQADYIIDLGPEGGEKGGRIVFEGTLPELLRSKESETGRMLRKQSEK
ncbi:excinuclease ABC subunit UvrA [candidate division WWE3 bacterium CG_4_10_14_0_2_um_filter_42_7]|uniref:UvrABC system protein A n=2 Tax=Katanobacteria TaxID=422282 RepID=A0A2H0XA77_UNCKA|nr:MAG: excinuclease ABC subunit UvrA [candidate division WWE3 bacterium CG08_land_8_20_14_0_20_41_15]PIZ43811.1 MAG: excinuclease ABC subunit UvrA [candidate division WWE3 bacterium CG_4_10_14_0_2_um_filter_42_7]